ncbi:hypothetical protein [Brazilian marseillevirus]|uniref:hypothetical protein n=1 Tax=Brazilian marseillevirus TaxID=1813599 RepID=UPI0007819F36|nr:hypothetical protein A3303_gp166 [Brazilian marseillevirus]AMQ10674.1 hypothetical protein [Brazilian marseillevirus]
MSRVNKISMLGKIADPLMWAWYIPMTGSGIVIAWEEGQDERNHSKAWYVMLPKVAWRTICWPYYIREYL